MPWYYAEGKERRGPVDDTLFQQLAAAGKIGPDTLVWKEGMANWQPLRALPAAGTVAAPPLPGHQRCIILGKGFPESQMIKTEHGWVSGEGKDIYYQSLREGLAIPVHVSETNARRDGKKVVVPVANPKLPARCMKTNQPVSAAEQKEKTLYWATPWIYLSILISLLITLILYLVLRKKIILTIPITAKARRSSTINNCGAAVLIIVGLFVLIGDMGGNTPGVLAALGLLMMVGDLSCPRSRASSFASAASRTARRGSAVPGRGFSLRCHPTNSPSGSALTGPSVAQNGLSKFRPTNPPHFSIRTRRSLRGNWSVTTVPTPSLLSTPTWPPCSRMIRCTIIRPRPWPVAFVVW